MQLSVYTSLIFSWIIYELIIFRVRQIIFFKLKQNIH